MGKSVKVQFDEMGRIDIHRKNCSTIDLFTAAAILQAQAENEFADVSLTRITSEG